MFLLLSFFRRLISEVAERNSTKIGHMVGSKCNLKTHVRHLGYPLSLQIEGPKTTFLGRLRNLRANLTAYIFGMKHGIDNRSSGVTTLRGLLHRPKMSQTLVHKRLQTRMPWCRIVNVNVTIEIRSRVSEAPKHFKLAMASRRGAFSANKSLIMPHLLVILVFV